METKAILCVIGAVLINLTLGTFYSIGNVVPYIASYMRNHGSPEVTSEDATWITAAFLLGQGIFLIVGAYLERLLDSRAACIFGCILHCACTYLTIWALDVGIFAVILLYGFGAGAGCGSSYMASIIAAQKWFPNKKGLSTGTIVAGFGFGGAIFTYLQTSYVNPDNLKADSSGYFSESVYQRVPNLFLYMGILFTVVQSVGCSLAFPPPSDAPEPANTPATNQHTIIFEELLPNMTGICSAFSNKLFYIIGLMMMLVAPGVTFVNSLGKRYGQIYIEDDQFLTMVVSVAAIANASGRLIWGYMSDKFSFSTCYMAKVTLFATLIALFPFAFILQSKSLYLIWMLGLFLGFSGTFVLFPVLIEQVYGAKYHGMIYGLLYIMLAISSILTSLTIKSLIDIQSSTIARFVPCVIIALLYLISLVFYTFMIPTDKLENAIRRRKELSTTISKHSLSNRRDLFPIDGIQKENSLGSIVRFADPT